MNVYVWLLVESIRSYATGQVIVMAETLDQAIALAVQDACQQREWDGDLGAVLETELRATEPIIYTSPVAFAIWGSE